MSKTKCMFCSIEPDRYLLTNSDAIAIKDLFPVSPGHVLIIPRRHIASLFDATETESRNLWDLVSRVRGLLIRQYSPDGFNIGINDGTAAGQTIMHLHIHLIPRYRNDAEDPRGGVRWVMPSKAPYWDV